MNDCNPTVQWDYAVINTIVGYSAMQCYIWNVTEESSVVADDVINTYITRS